MRMIFDTKSPSVSSALLMGERVKITSKSLIKISLILLSIPLSRKRESGGNAYGTNI
jgi:hypothetical protein